MSIQETKFLQWFGTIAATLIIASIIGLIGMYKVQSENVILTKENSKNIEKLRSYHKDDVLLIRDDMKEIKSDIKEILKAVK